MPEIPPLPEPRRKLHVLSGWALVLQIISALSFTGCFVVAANASKAAMQGWLSSACVAFGFVVAPLCILGALVTGIMGAVKSPGCLSWGIVILPLVLLGLMVLVCWAALVGLSGFR